MATQPITELFPAPLPPPVVIRQREAQPVTPRDLPRAAQEWGTIRRALAGNSEALAALFTPHRQELLNLAFRVLRNQADAEDAVQEGLLNAYRKLATFQGQSQFSTWLTKIVLNAALMKRRAERVRPRVSLHEMAGEAATFEQLLADARPDPEQACAQVERRRLLTELLSQLAPPIRSALQLRHVEGLSLVETAQVAGVSVSAMKTRLFRGRRQLAAYVRGIAKGETLMQSRTAARPNPLPQRTLRVGRKTTEGSL